MDIQLLKAEIEKKISELSVLKEKLETLEKNPPEVHQHGQRCPTNFEGLATNFPSQDPGLREDNRNYFVPGAEKSKMVDRNTWTFQLDPIGEHQHGYFMRADIQSECVDRGETANTITILADAGCLDTSEHFSRRKQSHLTGVDVAALNIQTCKFPLDSEHPSMAEFGLSEAASVSEQNGYFMRADTQSDCVDRGETANTITILADAGCLDTSEHFSRRKQSHLTGVDVAALNIQTCKFPLDSEHPSMAEFGLSEAASVSEQNGYFMRADTQSDCVDRGETANTITILADAGCLDTSEHFSRRKQSHLTGVDVAALNIQTCKFPLDSEHPSMAEFGLSEAASVSEQNGYFMRADTQSDCVDRGETANTITILADAGCLDTSEHFSRRKQSHLTGVDVAALNIQTCKFPLDSEHSSTAEFGSSEAASVSEQNGYFMRAVKLLNSAKNVEEYALLEIDTYNLDNADLNEFDDIIEYDPVSDDDEIHDGQDRTTKNPASKIEASVPYDGTVQAEEVASGYICEPPQTNFKSGSFDKTQMIVDTSDGPDAKKNCCPYCYKLQSKFARHIIDLHAEEADVQSLLKFDKKSKERNAMFDVLRKRGNHRFNTDTKINKTNKLIVSRRPNSKFQRNGKEFRACAFCLGTYSTTSARQHICSRKTAKGDRSLINLSRMVEGCWHKDASKALQTAMSGLNEDDIAKLVKYDWLLIMFGNSFCEQLDTLRQQKLVRQQLRILSRLLIEVKNCEATITNFASIFQTSFVDSVIAAIRVIGRFDSTTNYFKSPSPATNLVTLVKKVGLLLRDECIEKKNKNLKEQTEDFIALFNSRSTIKINKLAAKSRAKMMLEKVETMPSTDEINQFQIFINRKCEEYCNLLNAGSFSNEKELSKIWIKLVEVTLVSIMVFNRRRVGEMQLCEVSQYINRQKIAQNSKDLLFVTLSDESKQRVMRYSRMVMIGKRHRPVAVLLNSNIENRIDIMLKFRQVAGVSSKNKLLFALPSSFEDKPRLVDACAALRKLTLESGVSNPEDIRGTKMRKHFANFCATKEINDNTVTDVANFMGHSVDIHKKFYRGNALDRQVARISELLEESSGQCLREVVNVPQTAVKRKRALKAPSISKKSQSDAEQTNTNGNAPVNKKLNKQTKARNEVKNMMTADSVVNNKRKNESAQSNSVASEQEAENQIVNKKRKKSPKPVAFESKRASRASRKAKT